MIDFRNTKVIPININAFHISPSNESKYLDNTKSLSKTKENVAFNIDKPNTLYVGNNVHTAIEYSVQNNNDLLDTYEKVIQTIGYRDSELTRSLSQLHHAKRYNNKQPSKPKNTDFKAHERLNYKVGRQACVWAIRKLLRLQQPTL